MGTELPRSGGGGRKLYLLPEWAIVDELGHGGSQGGKRG